MNVKLKNSLELHICKNTIIKQICEFIKLNVENYDAIRNDVEFLRYILTLIKNSLKSQKQKKDLDKKKLRRKRIALIKESLPDP